jgi:pimeloyl-ACP methyl ester carboxylesterase
MTKTVRTPYLDIGYDEWGASHTQTVVLAHGWPDSVDCWTDIACMLEAGGCRVLVPHARGCNATQFRNPTQPRSGQIAALGHDLADFLEALDLKDVVIAGYDWGARAGYVVAALHPERLKGLVAMAAPYPPSNPKEPISYDLAKSYWYEWSCATDFGKRAFTDDRRGISRYLWESWSPGWTFAEDEFDEAAKHWENDDWPAISVHAYLHRWADAAGDPAYADDEASLAQRPKIGTATIVLHGAEDHANLPETTAGQDAYFLGHYERRLLPGVGHFVPREAPEATAAAIKALLELVPGAG